MAKGKKLSPGPSCVKELVRGGFTAVWSRCRSAAEFAIRGRTAGSVSMGGELPFRIDFFDDGEIGGLRAL